MIQNKRKTWLPVLLILFTVNICAQPVQPLTIDSCYIWAKRNYPLVKQYGLIEKSKSYSLDNVAKGYLPQVNFGGYATYQSEFARCPSRFRNHQ